jgi:hypothetical protein
LGGVLTVDGFGAFLLIGTWQFAFSASTERPFHIAAAKAERGAFFNFKSPKPGQISGTTRPAGGVSFLY